MSTAPKRGKALASRKPLDRAELSSLRSYQDLKRSFDNASERLLITEQGKEYAVLISPSEYRILVAAAEILSDENELSKFLANPGDSDAKKTWAELEHTNG